MKFLVFIFLAVLAIGSADEEECNEARAEACVDSLLSTLLGDVTEEEVCSELRTTVDCLQTAVDECLGDEADDEVKEGLSELEKLLKDNCEKSEETDDENEDDDEDEEMKKCLEENEEYVYECIYEGTTQALSMLIEKGNVDENALKCSMYSLMADCFVDRVKEKCGEEAGELLQKELEDIPEEIKEACDAAEPIDEHVFELLDKKKKK